MFSDEDITRINYYIKRSNGCALFEFTDGKLFLVTDHYKFLTYEHAGRRLICKMCVPKGLHLVQGKYWYLTDPIKRKNPVPALSTGKGKSKR